MSHPFTLAYMTEMEMCPNQIDERIDATKQPEIEQESTADKGQVNARPSDGIGERNSDTERCQTDQDGERLENIEQVKEETHAIIPDKERARFLGILSMAMRRPVEIFAKEESSIVGLSYLIKPTKHRIGSVVHKLVWTMLLLFEIIFMVLQIYDRTSYYLAYPTLVDYRVSYNESLRFPTVTICNEFLLSKGQMSAFGKCINFSYFHLRHNSHLNRIRPNCSYSRVCGIVLNLSF